MIQAAMPAKNEVVELEIESSAFEGKMVARLEGFVIFVPYAVPGDRIRARIVRRKKRYAEAVVEEVLRPSPFRVAPRCRYFGVCGGCRLQNVAYEKQLEMKATQVRDLLERIGGFADPAVAPVIPSPETYWYRNKMEFTFSNRRWLLPEEIAGGGELRKDFALGLHVPGRYDKVLNLEECFLQSETSARLVNRVREIALEQGWAPYDTLEHVGFLRNLVIREGQNTGERMVVLITRERDEAAMNFLAERLRSEFNDLTTFVNGVNSRRSPVAQGEEEFVHLGDGTIRDRLGELTFRITPGAFFQPNTLQAERLVEVIGEWARLEPRHLVFDLYCGIGSIGLSLAPKVRRVVGVESHAESVRLAILNARENGIENAEFRQGDALDALKPDFLRRVGKPDVVILDPPRAGVHPDVVKALLRLKPPRIVYTSCNPATLARDLQLLAAAYELEGVQPVDMFPQTFHVECVAALQLR
ncbi:MAG: 23S rRNA (uracil(1939)-C(5))-methyltransferase RlmD [Acidobacteriota bacterium]